MGSVEGWNLKKSEIAKMAFPELCVQKGIPRPETEYPFAQSKGRRWRFDYCWPDHSVALECDGGIWTRGRHTRGKGWLADAEKLNAAAAMGWRMLRCTPDQLCTSEMLDVIKQALVSIHARARASDRSFVTYNNTRTYSGERAKGRRRVGTETFSTVFKAQ